MIRLKRLVLTDVKNTRHGELTFGDLASGASVTGIYGQNGSGKTTVIVAIGVLKALMEGAPLGRDGIGLIRQGASVAIVAATFDMGDRTVEYSVAFEHAPNGGSRIVGESITTDGDSPRRRTLINHRIGAEDDMGMRAYTSAPKVPWRSLRGVRSADDILAREETLAWSEGRSFVFSPRTAATLERIDGILDKEDGRSAAGRDARDRILTPLRDVIDRLSDHARRNMRVVTTRDASSVSFDYAPISADGRRTDMLDISRPACIPEEYRDSVSRMVAQADRVMPALIPGLHVECDMRDAVCEDGTPGVEVFLRSVREGVSIPLWAESEGVRRIMGILSLLVRMFNEEDMLVAVDEMDSGIYEILLGDLLRTLADRGVGQLVFTAHNLRVLETLPADAVVFSTADADARFRRLPVRPTNNLRSMYIRMVSRGDSDATMATAASEADIAAALFEMGEGE